jgi:2,3-bisphosphoglycerate-dependent phosphoglycerate mutase
VSQLFLVRHAHSDYTPDEMRGLSPSGREDALRVADLLAGHEISAIVSSPYTRAVETVQPLADRLGLSIEIDSELRERCLSTGSLDDFERCLEATWLDLDLTYPGGESSAAAQARISRAIRRIAAAHRDGHVAIASHGNVLSLFLRTLDAQVDFAFWMGMSKPDVYVLDPLDETTWSHRRLWTAT